MLTHGAYARPGSRHPLAVDLGTSAVRVWTPGSGVVVNEPAVIAYGADRRSVGHAAAALARRRDVTLVRPVRAGVIENYAAAAHLLRVAVARTGRPRDDRSPVLVGVPATATLRQRNLLRAALRRAVDGEVTTVEEPLAAALACRADLDDDLVCADIGQGRTEVVRIADRAVAAAEWVNARTAVDQVPAIAEAIRRMTGRRVPSRRRRLLLTGGGATVPGVASQLAALSGRAVTVPADASLATLTGLRLLLSPAGISSKGPW